MSDPEMEVISREDAISLRLKRYFTGKPCARGHVTTRLASTRVCTDCANMHRRAAYQKNKVVFRERSMRWRHNRSPEARRAANRARKKTKAGREIHRANVAKRRATLLSGADGTVTAKTIRRLMISQRGLCNFCWGDIAEKYHLDHATPLSRGGLHTIGNVQLLCPRCNLEKKDKTMLEFVTAKGGIARYGMYPVVSMGQMPLVMP